LSPSSPSTSALLLKAGARLDDALELLSGDSDVGGLRRTVAKIRAAILSGESFGEALTRHPSLFPPMYVALVRVGEASGTLGEILEVLAAERARAEALRRKLGDALRYPAFVLLARDVGVVVLLAVRAAAVRRRAARLQRQARPVVLMFIGISEFLRANGDVLAHRNRADRRHLAADAPAETARRDDQRSSRLPLIKPMLTYPPHHFVLPQSRRPARQRVPLTTTLRILVDMMATTSDPAIWMQMVERVRHGGKLTDALTATATLPTMAVRMLRLGEETGQLPMLASRVRRVLRSQAAAQPRSHGRHHRAAAIVAISIIVGGLIVSVMTSLLSVSQIVG
jgi:general secretion pathway protein F